MYNVSQNYITQWFKHVQLYQVYGTLTDADGNAHTFNNDHILEGSFKVLNQCSSGSICFGSVYAGELDITFVNRASGTDPNYDIDSIAINKFRKGSITIYTALWIDATQTAEAVPLGVYFIREVTRVKEGIQIKAYDAMIKFSENAPKNLAKHGTPYYYLSEACTKCGVTLGQTQNKIQSFPNGNHDYKRYEGVEIENWRDVVYYIAQLLSCFATIDRSGQLILVPYPDYTQGGTQAEGLDYTLNLVQDTLQIADYTTKYGGIYVKDANNVQTYYGRDPELIAVEVAKLDALILAANNQITELGNQNDEIDDQEAQAYVSLQSDLAAITGEYDGKIGVIDDEIDALEDQLDVIQYQYDHGTITLDQYRKQWGDVQSQINIQQNEKAKLVNEKPIVLQNRQDEYTATITTLESLKTANNEQITELNSVIADCNDKEDMYDALADVSYTNTTVMDIGCNPFAIYNVEGEQSAWTAENIRWMIASMTALVQYTPYEASVLGYLPLNLGDMTKIVNLPFAGYENSPPISMVMSLEYDMTKVTVQSFGEDPHLQNVVSANQNANTAQMDNLIATVGGLREEVSSVSVRVSDGKKMIAVAITDKGVATASTDSFEVMASNIRLIPSQTIIQGENLKDEVSVFDGSEGAGFVDTVTITEVV